MVKEGAVIRNPWEVLGGRTSFTPSLEETILADARSDYLEFSEEDKGLYLFNRRGPTGVGPLAPMAFLRHWKERLEPYRARGFVTCGKLCALMGFEDGALEIVSGSRERAGYGDQLVPPDEGRYVDPDDPGARYDVSLALMSNGNVLYFAKHRTLDCRRFAVLTTALRPADLPVKVELLPRKMLVLGRAVVSSARKIVTVRPSGAHEVQKLRVMGGWE